EELKTSPIIESLRSAATKSFSRLGENVPVRITLVSDMVQNSAVLKQRSASDDFAAFKKSAGWSRSLVDLHHADLARERFV
ncbi:MAG: hypothetical protein K2Z81_18900, partial [Cyanobacteria bacterium]|nr:hypothetical protein [Cyanobacteriota bacterium]